MKYRIAHYRVLEKNPRRKAKDSKPQEKLLQMYNRKEPNFVPQTKGGKTVVVISKDNGEFLATGVSYCSMIDNFCYAKGRDLAMKKATARLFKDFT
jgi:hypothetical protein